MPSRAVASPDTSGRRHRNPPRPRTTQMPKVLTAKPGGEYSSCFASLKRAHRSRYAGQQTRQTLIRRGRVLGDSSTRNTPRPRRRAAPDEDAEKAHLGIRSRTRIESTSARVELIGGWQDGLHRELRASAWISRRSSVMSVGVCPCRTASGYSSGHEGLLIYDSIGTARCRRRLAIWPSKRSV